MFLVLSRELLPDFGPTKNHLRRNDENVFHVDLEQVNAAEFVQVSHDDLQSIQQETDVDEKLNDLRR